MKNVGIIRKLDDLGRIVLPREIRKNFNIVEKDTIEILVNGNTIILEKLLMNVSYVGKQKKI